MTVYRLEVAGADLLGMGFGGFAADPALALVVAAEDARDRAGWREALTFGRTEIVRYALKVSRDRSGAAVSVLADRYVVRELSSAERDRVAGHRGPVLDVATARRLDRVMGGAS